MFETLSEHFRRFPFTFSYLRAPTLFSMKRIGLISDTHGFLPQGAIDRFRAVDEIWHAGDVGDLYVLQALQKIKPVKAVYGNIDGQSIRNHCPEVHAFKCEDVKVLMIHIGGYPGKYVKRARMLIENERPKLFITGHSHILKVLYDEKYDLLHLNPGAAGKFGMHNKITFMTFIIEDSTVKDLQIVEMDRNQKRNQV